MKIIKPTFEILTQLDGEAILKHIEMCGRTCYQSEAAITDDSYKRFVENIINRGHESVLEHFSITVRFIVDRGISHEIARHRIASFSQESTRYCNYSNGKFGNEIMFIKPFYFQEGTREYEVWKETCHNIERVYLNLIANGATAQEARAILPNSLKTELIMTANLREWRHFLKLRTNEASHPQMREISIPLLHEFQRLIPIVFDDICS